MKVIVIGAGLSGAAVASALAQRGAEVTVLDLASAPAAGASSLPAGLMAPYISKDDNLTSQLVRLGLALTTTECQRLLRAGVDWQVCGALQIPFKQTQGDDQPAVWHANAAWVKPEALVRAWLAQPSISFKGGMSVQRVTCDAAQNSPTSSNLLDPPHSRFLHAASPPVWRAFDAADQCVAEASALVVAASVGSSLLAGLELHAVAGQIITGLWSSEWQSASSQRTNPDQWGQNQRETEPAALNHHALNGHGHFIPAVAGAAGKPDFWLSGSTYEHGSTPSGITDQGIKANCHRLALLLPAAVLLLEQEQQAKRLRAWAGLRCTTRDRLPAAGSVDPSALPGLYASVGMGSRGLSFAAICGQLVAEQIMGHTCSLPEGLQHALRPARLKLQPFQ